MKETKEGSHKNIWYGTGRQRIEIPRNVLRTKVQTNPLLKHLHICSAGFYPKAKDHYTYRKKGLQENFLFYCVSGHGWFSAGGQKFDVGPNEFFILPANKEHAYGSSAEDPWSIYWVHFGGEGLAALNKNQTTQQYYKPAHFKTTDEVLKAFTRIYKSLQLGYSIDNLLFANIEFSHFLSMFIYSNRHHESVETDKLDCVDAAILYMREHITENMTLGDLSRHYNYSVSRFSNLFRQKTGYAPIDYFLQMKMQKASQQLDFTNMSVKEIAFGLGFDDPYYFSKRFRTIIGISPKKYRALQKGS